MQDKTILIVDDDERFIKMLSFLFSAKGFNVITASNGEEAWKYLDSTTPDLMIMDLMMPEMDGFSLYRKIREQERLKKLPVIILSGIAASELLEKLEPADLKFCLQKPFRTVEILTLTRDALSSSHGESGNYKSCSSAN